MPLNKQQQEFVNRVKAKYPAMEDYGIDNDERFYESLRLRYPEKKLPPIEAPRAPRTIRETTFDHTEWQKNEGTFLDMATRSLLPEEWVEGSKLLQNASVNSTGGALFEAVTGKTMYKIPDNEKEDSPWYNEWAGALVGMANPVDISIFGASMAAGWYGGTRGAALVNSIGQSLKRDAVRKFAKTDLAKKMIVESGQALGYLSTHMAATGSIRSASDQKMKRNKYAGENGEISIMDTIKDTSLNVVKSLPLAAATGAIGGSMSHAHYKLFKNNAKGFKGDASKLLTSHPSRAVAEGVAFTTLPTLWGEGPRTMEEFNKMLAADVMMYGVFNSPNIIRGHQADIALHRQINAQVDKVQGQKIAGALENVKKEIEKDTGQPADKNIDKAIDAENRKISAEENFSQDLNNILDRQLVLAEKAEKGELSSAERLEHFENEVAADHLMDSHYQGILDNFDEHISKSNQKRFNDKEGALSDNEIAQIKSDTEAKLAKIRAKIDRRNAATSEDNSGTLRQDEDGSPISQKDDYVPNRKQEAPLLVETDDNLIDRYISKYPEMEERKVLERFGERDEAGNITGKLTESGKEIMLSHLGDRKQTIQPKPATEMIGEVRKKIAEGTFDTKSKSEWVGGDYVRSQIAAFIEKRQAAYKSKSTGENVVIGSDNISPKQEADISSFVATLGKKNTTSQKNLRILSDFLDNQNITDYSQITPKKVIKYLDEFERKFEDQYSTSLDALMTINEFHDFLVGSAKMNQTLGTPTPKGRPTIIRQRYADLLSDGDAQSVARQSALDRVALDKQVKDIIGKYDANASRDEIGTWIVGRLHSEAALGMRSSEVNKLTPSSVKIEKGTSGEPRYVIDITSKIAKKGTHARKVEIGKEAYEAIQNLLIKDGISPKDKKVKFLSEQKFRNNIVDKIDYGSDWGFTKRLDDVRKRLRTKSVTGDLQIVGREFEPTINYFFGHELGSTGGSGITAKYVQGLDDVKKHDIAKVLRHLMDGDMTPENGLILLRKLTAGSAQYKPLRRGEIDSYLKENPMAYSAEGTREIANATAVKRILTFLKEKYPDISLKVEDDLKLWDEIAKGTGIKNPNKVLGAYVNNAIYIRSGKMRKDVIPHEVMHHAFSVIRSMGDKFSKDLLIRAEKMFANDAKAYYRQRGDLVSGQKLSQRQLEEFIVQAMQGKLTGRITNKSIISKIKSYMQYLNAKITSWFGLDKLNRNQLENLIVESIYRRDGVPVRTVQPGQVGLKSQRDRVMLMTQQKTKPLRKTIKANLDKSYDSIGILDNKESQMALMEAVARQADIDEPEIFIKNIDLASEADLNAFNKALSNNKFNLLPKGTNTKQWFDDYDTIETMRLSNNMKELERDTLLFNMGVKDGNIWNATNEQLKKFMSIAGFKKKNQTAQDWITELEKSDIVGKKAASEFEKLIEGTKFASMPVDILVSKYSPKLANKLRSHVAMELKSLGKHVMFEFKTRKWLKEGGYSWYKGRDLINLLDKKRTANRMKATEDPNFKEANPLNANEQRFLRNAIDDNWNVKGKYIEQNGKKVWEGTPEARMAFEYQKLMNDYKDTFINTVRVNMNEAEFEAFMKEHNINWIDGKNNFYVHRKLTKEFKQYYDIQGRHNGEIVDAEAKRIAKKRAKGGEDYQKYLAEAREEAQSKLIDMFEFNTKRYVPGFLKSRHALLPERIYSEKSGKWIDVYENKYDNTVAAYSASMSKLIANVQYFPEVVKLKGFTRKGYKSDAGRLVEAGYDRKWADFIKNAVERHVGIPTEGQSFLDPFYNKSREYATLLAKLQLSFPTSGLKNLFLGSTGTAFAFGATKLLRSSFAIFDKSARDAVRAAGHTEIGLRHIEDSVSIFGYNLDSKLDTVFSAGFMKPTEDFNRIIAVHAGKMQFAEDVDALLGRNIDMTESLSKRTKQAAEVRMKDFWFLTDAEINHLKKYGQSLEGHNFKTDLEKMQARHIDEIITQKVDTFSHINTQGASVDLFMPNWAAHKGLRPLTLYKRMAFAASVNTIKNIKLAMKTGNYMNIVAGMVGTYGTGLGLMALYDVLLGTTPPAETEERWKRIAVPLWRGEFMGILSEFLQPIFGKMQVGQWAQPAIYSNLELVVGNITGLGLTGGPKTKTAWQAVDDYARNTFGIYGQIKKIEERSKLRGEATKFNRENIRIGKAVKAYQKEFGEKSVNTDGYKQTTRSPYYRDLKSAWLLGNDDEFARMYMVTYFTLVSDFYNDKTKFKTLDGAHKAASGVMKRKLSAFNPLGMSDNLQSGEYKIKAKGFLDYLKTRNPKVHKEARYAYREYWRRKNRFEQVVLPKFLKENSLEEFKKYYDLKPKEQPI